MQDDAWRRRSCFCFFKSSWQIGTASWIILVTRFQEPSPFCLLCCTVPMNRITGNTALLEILPSLLESLRACSEGVWECLGLGRNTVMEIITVWVAVGRSMNAAVASQGKSKGSRTRNLTKKLYSNSKMFFVQLEMKIIHGQLFPLQFSQCTFCYLF